mgnify:CR=1 FL=1
MADFKVKYAAAATITITLASLATSATRVAGQESTAIDNTTNLYLNALLSGKVTTGTTVTASYIDIWVYGSHDATPTYMDVLDGTDSAETFTDVNSRDTAMHLVHVIANDTTNAQTYWMRPTALAQFFGGYLPAFWGIFISHSTVAALNATGTNHEWKYTGLHEQSV